MRLAHFTSHVPQVPRTAAGLGPPSLSTAECRSVAWMDLCASRCQLLGTWLSPLGLLGTVVLWPFAHSVCGNPWNYWVLGQLCGWCFRWLHCRTIPPAMREGSGLSMPSPTVGVTWHVVVVLTIPLMVSDTGLHELADCLWRNGCPRSLSARFQLGCLS